MASSGCIGASPRYACFFIRAPLASPTLGTHRPDFSRSRRQEFGVFKGAITIARVAGVPIRVHWTFFVLLAWVFGAGFVGGGTLASATSRVAFVATIFACVVAHEFGHILTARAFGIRTRDVTLLPIGGVASLEKLPEKPWQELLVALAGPAVNVAIAAILIPVLVARGEFEPSSIGSVDAVNAQFVSSVAAINIWLVLFNMIPAFPMDGGRVLRAILAMGLGPLRATRLAALVGQVIAVAMAIAGLFLGLPLLLVLALFVFLGAGAEAASTQAREVLRGVAVREVMLTQFRVLSAGETLQAAVEELIANSQADFPVTSDGSAGGAVVGVLTRSGLVRALTERGPSALVQSAMTPACAPAHPGDVAREAYVRLQGERCPLVPVVEGGRLVGLLTAENFAESIMVRDALGRRAPGSPARG